MSFSATMGVPGKTLGSMFTPMPVELTAYDAEKVGSTLVVHGEVCIAVVVTVDVSRVENRPDMFSKYRMQTVTRTG